jgi:hypothetical protein
MRVMSRKAATSAMTNGTKEDQNSDTFPDPQPRSESAFAGNLMGVTV